MEAVTESQKLGLAADRLIDQNFGEIISSYTRAEAIDDGVLIDLTEWASSSKGFMGGFTVPVACTAAVFADIENIPPSQRHQDIRGRTHDMLFMASLACRRTRGDADRIAFKFIMHVGRKTYQTYHIHSGTGDNGEHVMTIMQPLED